MPANYLSNAELAAEIKRCQDNGYIVSDRLAKMLMLLVNRIAAKVNWRCYSFVADMQAEALVQLVKPNETNNRGRDDRRPNILKFDFGYSERNGRPPNPFAYATQIVTNVFRRAVKMEAAFAECRDDILELKGQRPSARRQAENDFNRSAEPILIKVRKPSPGRPKGAVSVRQPN